jgi:serine/threonine protein kinase
VSLPGCWCLFSPAGNKQSTVDTECSKSVQTGDENIHPPSPSSGGNNGDGSPGYLTAVDSPQSEPLPATPSFNTPIESAETSSEPLPDLRQSPESRGEPAVDEFPQQNPASEDRPLPVAQQPSLTNTKFVDRFSHKISLAFGQSTVIHHAHRCSRPSILRVNSPVLEELSKQGDCANDSSGPSTTPSSVSSPIGGQSSPLTPLTTGLTFSSSDKSKLCDEDGQKSAGAYWPSLSNIENTTDAFSDAAEPEVLPSIKTVEATSVAKVYLELYFNSIFQNKDLRQQRQLELEQHIYSFELTAEECSMTRHNWILRENDYLRKCRALKSNRCYMQSEETISIAGYKAVKVLGKGSFGVVRLVRKSDLKDINDENPLAVNENSFHARSNPLGVLKSAVEGAKQSRRRYMTGKRKEVYAMKVIKKAEMIRNCQEGHIRAERDFLVASERSRWVVPLIASFQDTNHLYLVMDYMVGGDFLGLLIRRDTLREDWARFYVAEMILCIEEAHRLLWIHRDVKPDNFLISASGHLKISDFGLAFNGHWSHDQAYYNSHRYSLIEKLGIDVKGDAEDQKEDAEEKELAPEVKLHSTDDHILQQPPSTGLLNWRDNKGRRRFAKSVVGTSQYMAPEVIRGEMYDGRCDWWSLGIILYEVRLF